MQATPQPRRVTRHPGAYSDHATRWVVPTACWRNDLKEADKKYTQKQLAVMMGVDRQTISRWLKEFASSAQKRTSGKPGAVTNPTTDSRVKVPPQAKPIIAERVAKGESQSQVAADLGYC